MNAATLSVQNPQNPPRHHPGLPACGRESVCHGRHTTAGFSRPRSRIETTPVPLSREVRSDFVDGPRRPEIGADRNAPAAARDDQRETCVDRGCDNWPCRKNSRESGAESHGACRRHGRSTRSVALFRARWARARVCRRRAAKGRRILRHLHGHWHRYDSNRLPQNPDAEGNEQGQRARTGKHTVPHHPKISPEALGFKLSVTAVGDSLASGITARRQPSLTKPSSTLPLTIS